MTLKINSNNIAAALAALTKTEAARGAENIQMAIQKFGWHAKMDGHGNVKRLVQINASGEQTRDLFEILAPFAADIVKPDVQPAEEGQPTEDEPTTEEEKSAEEQVAVLPKRTSRRSKKAAAGDEPSV